MEIESRVQKIYLSAREMFVVPKGVEHKPYAENEYKIMVEETQGVVNTGKADVQLTAPTDIWI